VSGRAFACARCRPSDFAMIHAARARSAIIDVYIDYETVGSGMLIVAASGTAVKLG
jgi:uncharacterized protein YbjQ (UPF0145 family)